MRQLRGPVLSVSDWEIFVTFSYRLVAKNAGLSVEVCFCWLRKTLSGFVTIATLHTSVAFS